MKTKRIKITKNERAEICIRKPNAGRCDGKNVAGMQNIVLIGPASVCIVVSRRQS